MYYCAMLQYITLYSLTNKRTLGNLYKFQGQIVTNLVIHLGKSSLKLDSLQLLS